MSTEIRFVYWNYELFKTCDKLFDVELYCNINTAQFLGTLYSMPFKYGEYSYNKVSFMVVDSTGLRWLYRTDDLIVGIPEEIYSLFSDLKLIDFKITKII